MSERTDVDFLTDIQEAISRITKYTTGITYKDFLADTKTQDAVIRNLEIIGEATKNLSGDLRELYTDVPWKGMAGIRDRLIHDYFGVNLDIVWQVGVEELHWRNFFGIYLTPIFECDIQAAGNGGVMMGWAEFSSCMPPKKNDIEGYFCTRNNRKRQDPALRRDGRVG